MTGQFSIERDMTVKSTNAISTLENLLEDRLKGISAENKGNACEEQKHLDTGTPEREYWHHGYASALKDVLRILQGTTQSVN